MHTFAFAPNIIGLGASDKPVVGAKVHQPDDFKRLVIGFLADRQPKLIEDEEALGFWTVDVSEIIPVNMLSFGIGKRTRREEDYVLRMYHGQIQAFLKRRFALPAEGCKVHIDTLELFRDEWSRDEETPFPEDKFIGVTHVVSDITIYAGPMQAGVPTPTDLVRQIARKIGKNERIQVNETINRAWESDRYWSEFCRVAD